MKVNELDLNLWRLRKYGDPRAELEQMEREERERSAQLLPEPSIELELDVLIILQAGDRDEAAAWRAWLVRAVAGSPWQLQPIYSVTGVHRLDELDLPWLLGTLVRGRCGSAMRPITSFSSIRSAQSSTPFTRQGVAS